MGEERWSIRRMHRGYVLLSRIVDRGAWNLYAARLDFDLPELPPIPADGLLLARGLPEDLPLLLPHEEDRVALIHEVPGGFLVQRGLEERLADLRRFGVHNAGIVLDTSRYAELRMEDGFLYRPHEAGVGPAGSS